MQMAFNQQVTLPDAVYSSGAIRSYRKNALG